MFRRVRLVGLIADRVGRRVLGLRRYELLRGLRVGAFLRLVRRLNERAYAMVNVGEGNFLHGCLNF